MIAVNTATAGLLMIASALTSGGPATRGKDAPMKYEVARVKTPITIDAKWDKPAWHDIKPLDLTHYMGDKPAHFPKVQAKAAYDADHLYVIFHVQDNYVRAVAKKNQGPVCQDSCAEFFVTPGTDVKKGYFNLEANCGGTILMGYHLIPRKDAKGPSLRELAQIKIAHTMPKIVEPEIAKPTTWTIEYAIPFKLLAKYMPSAVAPAPGVEWRANFYKCADKTSHPHWLTWSKVDRPKPDFHVPEFFGTLVFK